MIALNKKSPMKPGDRILDDYIVLKTIGKGGNGTVYLVEMANHPETRFAVKTLFYAHGKMVKRLESLLAELQAWFDIPPHPNIVTCRFFRTVQKHPVIFAEYVDGGNLSEWIHRQSLKSLTMVLDVSIQIVEALRVAHSRGVIHQDVKPQNVIMTKDGWAKLTDFGLAQYVADEITQVDDFDEDPSSSKVTFRGLTPLYCSPEQAQREPLDIRTDIYSWALTLLEMLLDCPPPWLHGSVAGKWFQTVNVSAVNPRFNFPGIQKIWDLIAECLSKNPQKRPLNCDVLQSRLLAVYKDVTSGDYPGKILVSPRTPGTKPVKLLRRVFHSGAEWHAPKYFVDRICKLLSLNPKLQVNIPPAIGNTRKVSMLAENRGFQRVIDWVERIRNSEDCEDVNALYLQMLMDYSQVCFELEDFSGAENVLSTAIRVLESLRTREGFQAKYADLMIRIAVNLAESCRLNGRFDDASEILAKAADFSALSDRQVPEGIQLFSVSRYYRALGNLCSSRQNHDEALRYVNKALEIVKNVKCDTHEVVSYKCMCLQFIATIMGGSGRLNEARQFMEQAMILARKLDNSDPFCLYSISAINCNMGHILNKDNNPEAIHYLEKAIELASKDQTGDVRFTRVLSRALLSKATFYSRNDMYRENLSTLKLLNNLLDEQIYLHGRTDFSLELLAVLNNLSAILYKLGRHSDVVIVGGRGCLLSEYLQRNNRRDDVKWMEMSLRVNLSSAYMELGQYEESLREIEKVIDYRIQRIAPDNAKQTHPLAANALISKANILLRLRQLPEAMMIAKLAVGYSGVIDSSFSYDNILIKIHCHETYGECLIERHAFDDLMSMLVDFDKELQLFKWSGMHPITDIHWVGLDLLKSRCLIHQGLRREGVELAERLARIVNDEKNNRFIPRLNKKASLIEQILVETSE